MFLGGIFTIDACSFYASIFICGVKIGAWPDLNWNWGLRLTAVAKKKSQKEKSIHSPGPCSVFASDTSAARCWQSCDFTGIFNSNLGRTSLAKWHEPFGAFTSYRSSPPTRNVRYFSEALIILSLECISEEQETEPCQFVPAFDHWQQRKKKKRKKKGGKHVGGELFG